MLFVAIYGFIDGHRAGNYHVLVIDFGGGTFEVSLANVQNGSFEIISVDGDDQLGGREIDFALRDYVAGKIREAYDLDCLAKKGRAQMLLNECEKLKISLSSLEEDRYGIFDLRAMGVGRVRLFPLTNPPHVWFRENLFPNSLFPIQIFIPFDCLEISQSRSWF